MGGSEDTMSCGMTGEMEEEDAGNQQPEDGSHAGRGCRICSPHEPHSPAASTDQEHGLLIGWSGADQGFRLSTKPYPGILRDGGQRRSIGSITVSGDTRLWRRGGFSSYSSSTGSSGIMHSATGVGLCRTKDDNVHELLGFLNLV